MRRRSLTVHEGCRAHRSLQVMALAAAGLQGGGALWLAAL